MDITGDKLLELMFFSMTNDEVVETIDKLGLEQPILDEQYEIDQYLHIGNQEKLGISLIFKEVDGCTKNGDLCFSQVDFYNDQKILPPFGLSFNDNYEDCCRKLGKRAEYYSEWSDKLKVWTKESQKSFKYSIAINFRDVELFQIKTIIVSIFNNRKIGNGLLENKV